MTSITSNSVNAAFWELGQAENETSESMLLPGHEESTFDVDNRERIDAADFAPGGKYRGDSTHS